MGAAEKVQKKKASRREAPKAPMPTLEEDGPKVRPSGSAGIAWLTAVVVATGGITAFYAVRADLGEERVAHAEARVHLVTSRDEVASLQKKVAALEAERAALAAEARARAEALQQMEVTQRELEARLEEEIARGGVLISQQHGELVVDLLDRIVFDSGQAELNESGRAVLQQVGETLAGVPDKMIQVSGHTDALPISRKLQAEFPTNWELSTARATHVVRFLQEEIGIPGERLVAAGQAEFRPVASNRSRRGRSRNRRIEVRLLPLPGAMASTTP